MNFCPNCGSPLAPGSKFCSSCGSAIASESPAAAVPPISPVPPVQPVSPATNSAEDVSRLMDQQAFHENQRTEVLRLSKELDRWTAYRKPGLLVWGIILSVIGIITAIVLTELISFSYLDYGDWHLAVILIWVSCLFLGGLLIFLYILKTAKRGRMVRKLKNELNRVRSEKYND